MILCESDDLVFELDCEATSGCGVHYWFVKQEARNMRSEECAILYNLRTTRQGAIDRGTRTCTREATHLARPDPVLPGLTCITGESCHQYIFLSRQNFGRDKLTFVFVATKHVFCRDKTFVTTNTRLSRQTLTRIFVAANIFCRD